MWVCGNPKPLLAICAVSEVVGQPLISFPSSNVPLFHVCPAHPLPFSAPVYHDNSFQPRASPMHCPDHRWLLAGAFSLLQPKPRIVKRLARPARIPCKQPPPQLVVSATLYDQGGREGVSGFMHSGVVVARRGSVWFYVANSLRHFQWTGKLLRTNCSTFNLKGRIKEMVHDKVVSRPDTVIGGWVRIISSMSHTSSPSLTMWLLKTQTLSCFLLIRTGKTLSSKSLWSRFMLQTGERETERE